MYVDIVFYHIVQRLLYAHCHLISLLGDLMLRMLHVQVYTAVQSSTSAVPSTTPVLSTRLITISMAVQLYVGTGTE